MRFLLDENFPLGLIRALQSDGLAADHIITLGWRGASDKRIRERLQDAQIVFFTQDDDFLRLHASGVTHAGIAYAPQGTSVGDIIRGLMLIHQLLEAKDMKGHVEYL